MVHKLLWVGQVVFGVYFIAIGIMHFVVPEGLPAQLEWMYELPDTLHLLSGTAEILGGIGLLLPGLTRIRPGLVPLAAAGLAVVMLVAATWHVPREEWTQVALTLVNAVLLAGLAYGRWRVHPIPARSGT